MLNICKWIYILNVRPKCPCHFWAQGSEVAVHLLRFFFQKAMATPVWSEILQTGDADSPKGTNRSQATEPQVERAVLANLGMPPHTFPSEKNKAVPGDAQSLDIGTLQPALRSSTTATPPRQTDEPSGVGGRVLPKDWVWGQENTSRSFDACPLDGRRLRLHPCPARSGGVGREALQVSSHCDLLPPQSQWLGARGPDAPSRLTGRHQFFT